MTAANYPRCLQITLKLEGGDVDHPQDPGGKTRWGITHKTYDAWRKAQGLKTRSVFEMTKTEMMAIYKTEFWDRVKGDLLAMGVDLCVWDYGVNSGPSRALKAFNAAQQGDGPVPLIKRICARRLKFVQGLKTWKTFGKGWTRRISTIEAEALIMAGQTAKDLAREAKAAAQTSKTQTKAATGAGAGSAATAGVAVGTGAADWAANLAFFGVFVLCLCLLAYLATKAGQQKTRAAVLLDIANRELRHAKSSANSR